MKPIESKVIGGEIRGVDLERDNKTGGTHSARHTEWIPRLKEDV